MDADDLYLPEYLEFCLKTLIEQDLDLVAPKMMDFKNRPNKISKNDNNEGYLFYGKQGIRDFLYINQITVAILCKKSVLEAVGGFSWHDRAEDLHCWLKILFAGYKIYRIDETLLLYRLVENSMSSTDRNCSKEVFEIIYRFKDEILSLDIDFQVYINHWLRKYVFLQDERGNILPNISERMAYVNTILPNFFPEWLIKLPLGEKITKLVAIQVMNRKIKEI